MDAAALYLEVEPVERGLGGLAPTSVGLVNANGVDDWHGAMSTRQDTHQWGQSR